MMAIYLKNCKTVLPFVVCCCTRSSILTTLRHHSNFVTFETETDDALDKFTTNLIETKAEKWNKTRRGIFKTVTKNICDENTPHVNVANLNVERIERLFENLFEHNNTVGIISLINKCVEHNKTISPTTIVKVLCICSASGDVDTILQMRTLCDSQMLHKYSHFEHHIAEAHWRKGNLNTSTQLFLKVYKENESLRKTIVLMLKYLIGDIMCSSEGALLSVIKFCERLSRDFGENLPLFYVWQGTFASDWYSDRCIADELLEKHEILQEIIIERLHYIVASALVKHQCDVVYRLLEYLLKKNIMEEYAKVVLPLLNYKIHQRDLRSCKEILHWCEQYNIELPYMWQENYLKLLLGFSTEVTKPRLISNTSKNKFNIKF